MLQSEFLLSELVHGLWRKTHATSGHLCLARRFCSGNRLAARAICIRIRTALHVGNCTCASKGMRLEGIGIDASETMAKEGAQISARLGIASATLMAKSRHKSQGACPLTKNRWL